MYKNKTSDGDNNLCGRRIKEIRKTKFHRLSQRRLAAKLCEIGLQIDKNAIQRIESGKRFVIDVELPYFVKVLNVTYDDLLSDKD